MARQEINIFGTSFLDLLSGALAAVIILFIIVPKMSVEQQQALEEIEQLNVQVEELSNLMEQIHNSVPQEVYEQIQSQIEALQQTIENLSEQVENLQGQLVAVQSENERLRSEVENLRQSQERIQELQQENERQRQRIEELERQAQQANQNGQGISDGKVFGMNAQLGVVCIWTEDVDVDLYVKNLETGETCCFSRKVTPFGNLNEDITSRSSADDDRYELFYQSRIIPGRYQIYVNIYGGQNSRWNGQPANVDGYAVIFPGKSNQVKIPFNRIRLTQKGQNVTVGTLVVTNNNIQLQ